MSQKIFIVALLLFLFLLPQPAHAIEDPLIQPNNKIGIHILFGHELPDAAKLVNSNGGDWGYVTIPLSIQDMNYAKWQRFMSKAKELHLIPIVRLVTNPYPGNTKTWRKPTEKDIIAFSSFLNSLDWPTTNRYVVIFNEVNRGDEWAGAANPAEYARILSYSVNTFKNKNPDFFIISAGLDNAAPSRGATYMNEYDFFTQMHNAVPGIFNQIDGMSSHSYPNPGFAQPPDASSRMGIGSFVYERDLMKNLDGKELPVFITETGWSADTVPAATIDQYYQQAFATIWADPNIVTVTPFLLDGRAGPFQKFSFLTATGGFTQQYEFIKNLPKVQGTPKVPEVLAAADTKEIPTDVPTPTKTEKPSFPLISIIQSFWSWIKGE